jgi:exosortase
MPSPSLPPVPPITEWESWIPERPVLIAWAVLLGVMTFTYWGTLTSTLQIWAGTEDYGHCFFVPVFAGFLLWVRQRMVHPWPEEGEWWALALFGVWALIRWATVYFNYALDLYSLFPFLVGLALFVGGWKALRWAWPAIAFLIFMIPLPGFLAVMLSLPLQRIAARISLYCLQTMGVPALIPGGLGNVIQLSDPNNSLDVARACSGLRMLMLFFAICVGAALLIRATWWEKILLILAALPIAVISNVMRITTTGLLMELVSPKVGHWFHEYCGFAMMIPALLMLFGAFWVWNRLLIEEPLEKPKTVAGSQSGKRAVAASLASFGSPGGRKPRPPQP